MSYADELVFQRLVTGLCNPDRQQKILTEAATISTPTQNIERLQILEIVEESSIELHKKTAIWGCSNSLSMGKESSKQVNKYHTTQQQQQHTGSQQMWRNVGFVLRFRNPKGSLQMASTVQLATKFATTAT